MKSILNKGFFMQISCMFPDFSSTLSVCLHLYLRVVMCIRAPNGRC